MEMGRVAGRMLLTGASLMRKLSEAPESAIAWSDGTSFSMDTLLASWMGGGLDVDRLSVTT
eukprot:scaffold3126_cov154-Skeletonema_menzelii.AAC.1